MNRDVLFSIALELDLPDIVNLCRTSMKVNEYVCRNRNFWINKIKKDYPKVPIEKIQDPRSLYRKLFNIKRENAQWNFWYALREQDNDLVNSLPYIYEVTYPDVIVTHEDKWRFFETSVKRKLLFDEGFAGYQLILHDLLKMIIDNGVSIENFYDLKEYQKMLEQARKESNRDKYIEKLLLYLRKQYKSATDFHKSLTDILYNYLKEKGQVYPSGTPYEKIYVK